MINAKGIRLKRGMVVFDEVSKIVYLLLYPMPNIYGRKNWRRFKVFIPRQNIITSRFNDDIHKFCSRLG